LVGKVRNTGLVEVPMGITLKRNYFDIGGGIQGGRSLKLFRPAVLQADVSRKACLTCLSILMS